MRQRCGSPQRGLPAAERLGSRSVRLVLLCSALLLLMGCVPGRASSTATVAPTATLTPTPALEALPTPVTTLLDPPPTNCPASPPPHTLTFPQGFGGFSGSVTFYGSSPVWIADSISWGVLHLNALGYTPWPGIKLIWEVGPNYTKPASIEVTNLGTGQLAWWGQGGPISQSNYGAATELELDPTTTAPAAIYHGPSEQGWNEWGSFAYLLQAGCYALDATWPGGHWRAIFAAGR